MNSTEAAQPLGLVSSAQLGQADPERAAFEAFAEEWTGRSMAQLVAGDTWGLGLDSFAWACWRRAKAAEREQIALAMEADTFSERKSIAHLCDGEIPPCRFAAIARKA